MIKKAILLVVGLGLTTVVLFGRNAASYVSTTYHRLTDSVQEAVPVDFQIDRAKQMVRDLDPEIRRSMHVIAKEEVAVEQLNQPNHRQPGKGRQRTSRTSSASKPTSAKTRARITTPAARTRATKSSRTCRDASTASKLPTTRSPA